MARTTVPLTLDLIDTVAAIDVPCRACLFWELDPVSRERVPADERLAAKEAWISEVLREWGSCGRVAMVDGAAVGYAVYAPQGFVPGSLAFPTAPASPDAVVLTTVQVAPEHASGGIGRLLVQQMARDLIGRRAGIRAVEAFAVSHRRAGVHQCVVPQEFLARVGFKTHRPHPRTPRMRMDLRSAVTWRGEFEAALEKLAVVVRPPAPAPVKNAAVPHEKH